MAEILIYVTTKNQKEAKNISQHLLKKKLIACANFFPISSMYRWREKMESGQEFCLILKTVEKNYSIIVKEVEMMHSYEVPCIAKVDILFNKKYGKWVKEHLK